MKKETPNEVNITPDVPRELVELVSGILALTAERSPDQVIIIAAVPQFWGGKKAGLIWGIVEDAYIDEYKHDQSYAEVLALTGNPFTFQHYHGSGLTDRKVFPAVQLSHVMTVRDLEVLKYYGSVPTIAGELFPQEEEASSLSSEYNDDWFENIEPIENQ